jgi:DNA-binding CsgD family transcriptional regulator
VTETPQVLVERDDLLEEICGLLDDLVAGNSSVTVLDGPVGHGKTALLNGIYQMTRWRPEVTVRYASCSVDEADLPLGVLQQLLGVTFPLGPDDEQPVSAETKPPADAATRAVGPPGDVLSGLYGELTASTPLVVLVDDLAWCDEPSLRVLTQLRRRLHQIPVMLVLAWSLRDTARRRGHLVDLIQFPGARIRKLRRFGRDGSRALCRSVFPDASDEVADACHELSGGIPLLLKRLVQALQSGPNTPAPTVDVVRACLPADVGSVLLTHARRRGPHLEGALRKLSVLRSPVRLDHAATILDTDVVVAADTVAELERLGLARAGGGVVIVPELARRSVLSDLRPSERHEVAARAATVLATEDRVVEAARYLVDTYPSGSAANVDLLVRAASRAGADAGAQSVAFLRRALAEPPQCEEQRLAVLTALGAAELRHDDVARAAEHLAEALAGVLDGEERTLCALQLAHALVVTGRTGEALALLERELAHCELPRNHPLVLRMLADQVFVAFEDQSGPADLERRIGQLPTVRTQPLDPVPAPSCEEPVTAAVQAFVAALACRPPRRSLADLRPVLSAEARPSGDGYFGLMMIGVVLLCSVELAAADRFFTEMAISSQSRGAPLRESVALWLRALVANRNGRLADARNYNARASRLLERRQCPQWQLPLLLSAVENACESGSAMPALHLLAAHGLTEEIPQRWSGGILLAGRGQLRLTDGDFEGGLVDLTNAGQRLVSIGCLNPEVAAWRSMAALGYARLRQFDQAATLAEEEVELAQQWGGPRGLATALWRRGFIVGGAAGIADIETAVELACPKEMPLVRARALMALGKVQHRASRLGAARAALTEAYELATRCEAAGLAGHLSQELLAAGGRPRVRNGARERQLTASEKRVAVLAAQGWTNDGIARELYLARRTVEAHLTSVYRKLDIHGRAQLVTAMGAAESS